MYRRSLLSWLGASAATALGSRSVAQTAAGSRIVALESFCVCDADQMPRLHSYIGNTLLPHLSENHSHPRMVLEAIVAPRTPQLLFVAVFSNFQEMVELRDKTAADPRIRQARASLEAAGVVDEVRSQILIAREESLRFPANLDNLKTGIFEVRSYQASNWQEGPPARAAELFTRAGIHPIVDASTTAGEHVPQFTYLIPFASLEKRQQAWDQLGADSDWSAIVRRDAVNVTAKSIYKLA